MPWSVRLKGRQVAPTAAVDEHPVPTTPLQEAVTDIAPASRRLSKPWPLTAVKTRLRGRSLRFSISAPRAFGTGSFRKNKESSSSVSHHGARRRLLTLAQEVVDAISSEGLEEVGEHIEALYNAYQSVCNDLGAPSSKPPPARSVLQSALHSPGVLARRDSNGGPGRMSRAARRSKEAVQSIVGHGAATQEPLDGAARENRRARRRSKENPGATQDPLDASRGHGAQEPRRSGRRSKEGDSDSASSSPSRPAMSRRRGSMVQVAGGDRNRRDGRQSSVLDPHLLAMAVNAHNVSMDAPEGSLYDPESSGFTGFLIDLDGTMYEPGGLLPGAQEFYKWLVESGTPHVFLSNTGAKNSLGVQRKFRTPPFVLAESEVPLSRILTAGEAQVDYMLNAVPEGAKLLVVAGGEQAWRSDLRTRGGKVGAAKVDTWDIRTALSDEEAKAWAASQTVTKGKKVWVAFFTDGEVGGDGESFQDWSFEVIKIASFLLSHGAKLVYTADDAFNPSIDPKHPGLVFPLPGPGMFAEMMRKLMYPYRKDAIACVGKGGNQGDWYMMEAARQMLLDQGHDGDPSKIIMVGDRFDTDVRAGLSAGLRTCLVTSGCHTMGLQQHYMTDPVHFHAAGVGALVPSATRGGLAGTPALAIGNPRLSVVEAVGELEAWMQHSSGLKPGVQRAEETRSELREVLRHYFSAVDVYNNGILKDAELEAAFDQQCQAGIGELQCQLLQKVGSRLPPGGGLVFEQFVEVMEEGLSDSGFSGFSGFSGSEADVCNRRTPADRESPSSIMATVAVG